MVLLTGPAGSGKTFRVLERLREGLRRRDAGLHLLTPTATMAQNVQNRMAQEGFVFRPGIVQTLSRFVDAFAAEAPQVSEPLLYLIVEEAAREVKRPEFARVDRLPGFCAALARTIEELSSAGCDPQRLAAGLGRQRGAAPLGEAFLEVYKHVDGELRRRGLATRSQRLMLAAKKISNEGMDGVHTILMDGFYALPEPELAAIGAMCRRAEVTLTLPSAAITEATKARLFAMGFAEEVCSWAPPSPKVVLCAAPSIEREADEIARRILEEAGAGRPFRDMGVILRSPEIYEPLLRATFDRFGIPARFYFDAELSHHALIRFLSGVVDALLDGWEYAATLAAVRLAPGIACDAFDFAVKEKIPGKGLAVLRRLAEETESPAVGQLLETFERLAEWETSQLPPPAWAKRLAGLRDLFNPGWLQPAGFEAADMGRGQAAALELFAAAMQEAAGALEDKPVELKKFWSAAKSVLRLTPLRVADARRNVVHVLGAHEARQWRLPVIFVCGLVEKQFPKLHSQDPFFPEAARAQLNEASIRLRTAADFEMEERFLFDSASTRAGQSLTLSYPRTDARGQQTLPSLYLEGLTPVVAKPISPRVAGPRPASATTAIASPDLLQYISQRYPAFQPTSLEVYLQCPFQFFGRDTLRLRGAPLRPEERLDFRTQGMIVHGVLAEMHRAGLALGDAFERVFDRIAKRNTIAPGYRTEALRERMLADLTALVNHPKWSLGCQVRVEQEFQYSLADDVELRGRIDRIDVAADGSAYVIDYKYSRAQGTMERAEDVNLLQSQLYMRAVERCFNLKPVGMSYWGFKGGIKQTDWALFAPAPAIQTTLRVIGEIRSGQVRPHPANPDKCRLCDFRDACRFVVEPEAIAEGASAWD